MNSLKEQAIDAVETITQAVKMVIPISFLHFLHFLSNLDGAISLSGVTQVWAHDSFHEIIAISLILSVFISLTKRSYAEALPMDDKLNYEKGVEDKPMNQHD